MSLLSDYFESSFDGVWLHVVSFRSNGGRDIVVQSPSRGDTHMLQDRGRTLRETSCEIAFCDSPGRLPYVDRFKMFLEKSDAPGVFVHPVAGAYNARITSLSYSADDSTLISCSVTFIEDQEAAVDDAPLPSLSGVESVTAAASLATELTAGETVAAPAAKSTVTAWSDVEDLSASQVAVELAARAKEISDEIAAYELAADPNQWEAYKSLVKVRYELVRAASAATRSVTRLIEFPVEVGSSLLQICARVYGAALAIDRVYEVASINQISSPAYVAAGTILKLPADGS